MGEALSQFVEEAQHLSSQFDSTTVFSIAGWNVSQYVLYMLVALVLVAALVLIAGRKLTLVPHGKFAHIFEFGYNFISEGVGADVIGEGFKKHVPFLATLFFFILTANIIGLIPGAKAAMGTISITWALAAISFIYFNFWGLKELGFFHYFKSLCPSGVPAPIAPIIWFLEFFSMVIRVLTLAVRLYGNMFAGHMILGIFAIMTQFFILDLISFANPAGVAAIAWAVFLVAMYALECLVAFLQAYVFSVLTAVYVGLAQSEH